MTPSGRYTIRLDLRPGRERAAVWNASTGIKLTDDEAIDVLRETSELVADRAVAVRQAEIAAQVLGGTRWPR